MKRKTMKHAARRKSISFEAALAQRSASTQPTRRKSIHSDHTAAEIAIEDGAPIGLIRFTDLGTPIS